MLELFGYLAFFEARDLPEGMDVLDDAAQSAGLAVLGPKQGEQQRRLYRLDELEPLGVTFARGRRWTWASLDAIDRPLFSAYSPGRIGALLRGLNAQIGAVVGRSFSGSGFGTLEEYEGEGTIDFLDWYQYLGPAHVKRWGLEHLLNGPFHMVKPDNRGGCEVLLGVSPFEGRLERKKAASYLGITLRPLFAKNSKGESVRLEWE